MLNVNGASVGDRLGPAASAERSGDLFGKLKADVKVTRQPRKRSAAAALRILFVTRRRSCRKRESLVEHKNRAGDRVLCTAEFGNLEPGEMSVLGMVEVVKGHRARVRTPGGDLVYVVAPKERAGCASESGPWERMRRRTNGRCMARIQTANNIIKTSK